MKEVLLGGGCFWCLEAIFQRVPGVVEVLSGYAGGTLENPSYRQVCSGKTGHAEVLRVRYEEEQISGEEILRIFFGVHDPTTLNRQGHDVGTQYRSVIFYAEESLRKQVEQVIAKLDRSGTFPGPIVTEVSPMPKFYPAEEEHRNYYQSNPNAPYCRAVISPKVSHYLRQFSGK